VLLGTWFLTVWDLVLDPAMAHESLLIKFWVWDESGPYFGMPVKNFIGWSLTGLVFMGVSRLIWRSDVDTKSISMRMPFAIYGVNLLFAMVLSAGVGLWIPVMLSIVLGLIPAVMALMPQTPLIETRQMRLSQDG
jgi:putative membrane protein